MEDQAAFNVSFLARDLGVLFFSSVICGNLCQSVDRSLIFLCVSVPLWFKGFYGGSHYGFNSLFDTGVAFCGGVGYVWLWHGTGRPVRPGFARGVDYPDRDRETAPRQSDAPH